MPLKLSYPHEKFSAAVESMATGSGSIQGRIKRAYNSFHPISAKDFDEYPEMKESYNEIMERLTVVKDSVKGYVPATLEAMTDSDAEDLAQIIWDLYRSISRVYVASIKK